MDINGVEVYFKLYTNRKCIHKESTSLLLIRMRFDRLHYLINWRYGS
jgi:hypothetical protein